MPAFGLGTWNSPPGEVGAAVRTALELGYRHIDCAAVYGNEAEVGEAFARAFSDGVVAREDVWITSKLWCNAHRESEVSPALERTLADLRCEYLDLYLVHWPVALRAEASPPAGPGDYLSLEEVPLEETWAGMRAVKARGLCRHIGVSNYSSKKLRAHAAFDDPPEVDQVEMHPYLRQDRLVGAAAESGARLMAYSPLGSGARPATLQRSGDPVLLEDPAVRTIAAELSATPAQVLIAWALARGTCAIPKSTNPGRIEENLGGATLELDAGSMARLDALDRGLRYVHGAFWAKEGSPYSVENLWDGDA